MDIAPWHITAAVLVFGGTGFLAWLVVAACRGRSR